MRSFMTIMKRLAPAAEQRSALETGSFEKGLYGVSEMLFEAFLGLIDAGILKREVDGVVLHGAFFLGPKSFYRALREMTPEQIARIQMMPVSFTNELYGDEDAKRRARVDARFVNNAMMATLMGAVISDGLEDGQVVSGVGGQYNFVAQAFALEGARSILTVEATRQAGAEHAVQHPLALWPRDHSAPSARCHRYRIWRCRSQGKIRRRGDRRDAGGDGLPGSRTNLMRQAKDAGKLPKDFEIPAAHRDNHARTDQRRVEARARGRTVAVVSVRQRFYRSRAAADPGAANAAGRATHAAASGRVVVARFYARARRGR